MKTYFSIAVVTIMLSSCLQRAQDDKTVKLDSIPKTLAPISLEGCYEMIIAKDTAFMKIEQNKDVLNGTLTYKRKDKDSNKGIVVLAKSGERAEGYYTFQSEGQTSVRQIVFKINNNSFSEGYGDIEMKNDTAIYKYPHALNFEEKHSFNKISCK